MSTDHATTVETETCSLCGVTFSVPVDEVRSEQMHATLAVNAGWTMGRWGPGRCWAWHCQQHSPGGAYPLGFTACALCGNQVASSYEIRQVRELGVRKYLLAHGWTQHPGNAEGWVCPAHDASTPATPPSSEQGSSAPVASSFSSAFTSVICATCGRITFPPNPDLGDAWLTNAGWRSAGPGHWICDRHQPDAPEIKGLTPAGWTCQDCGEIGLYGEADVAEHWCPHGDVVTLRRFFRPELKQKHPQSTTHAALSEVAAERRNQDAKWGLQSHEALFWLGILMEEVGEVGKAAIEQVNSEQHADGPDAVCYDASHWRREYRAELLQVAAVAVAAVEALDREGV